MIDFDALERVNAPLNAFSHFDRSAKGGEGVLAGVTIGVKANIAVQGMPFHAGMETFRDRIAEKDAETVAKLLSEGAAIIGILNMEEAALGSKTDNPHFGQVINPHKAGYSPGGSSGGSGAAVAAGLCDAALGTDTMGSVRIPAAHCGVYGFKPATDRVSQDGLEPADPQLDAIGPLARDLDMLERVSRVMSEFGEAAIEGSGAQLANHGVKLDSAVAEAFSHALGQLDHVPASVELPDKNSRIRFAGFIQVSRYLADAIGSLHGLSDHLRKLLTYGPKRAEGDWAEDQQLLEKTRDAVRVIVAQHGFLIMPTAPNAPFAHSDKEPAGQADFTGLANFAGLPAISLPMGWTDDRLPLGVQIVAQSGAEAGLFALARQLDAKLGAYRAPQPLAGD
ncbi:amidase [Altererythrobacter sp. MF3-039]|uniref:amidase n=1 Tax=Altererythrobacter sp. MF3-039 TaxID=3252901 RepID=UPI00390C73EA